MSLSWTAWKAATRLLLWTIVECITGAITLRKEAQRALTAFNPSKPRELFACGYACFTYDLSWDAWVGVWRSPDHPPMVSVQPQFAVHNWGGIPWHSVTFSELPNDKREFRAVDLKYAERHLLLFVRAA